MLILSECFMIILVTRIYLGTSFLQDGCSSGRRASSRFGIWFRRIVRPWGGWEAASSQVFGRAATAALLGRTRGHSLEGRRVIGKVEVIQPESCHAARHRARQAVVRELKLAQPVKIRERRRNDTRDAISLEEKVAQAAHATAEGTSASRVACATAGRASAHRRQRA